MALLIDPGCEQMPTLERAALVPLTGDELAVAGEIIRIRGVCIAEIQRRMQIGWNRAADLAEAIVGHDALPEVAKGRYASR
jgi:tartrate dehydratase beta subunit/fumarate hydratase class I family protein